ncbi:hypothetical protein Tco_0419509, partial [Tanacetum coccineum]
TMIEDFDNVAFGQIVTMAVSEHFFSYEAKRRLEICFRVERKLGFLRGVGRKELGERNG